MYLPRGPLPYGHISVPCRLLLQSSLPCPRNALEVMRQLARGSRRVYAQAYLPSHLRHVLQHRAPDLDPPLSQWAKLPPVCRHICLSLPTSDRCRSICRRSIVYIPCILHLVVSLRGGR